MSVGPPGGDDGGPGTVEFGIAALAAHVEEGDLDFPADQEEVIRALDDPDVAFDANGRSVALSAALAETPKRRFDSERELLNALHPVFESYRESATTGLVVSIRNLMPF